MKHSNKKSGFTLVEMMISTTILTLVLSGLASSFIFTARSSVSMGNYSDMAREGSHFLETFAREVRMASDVTALSTEAFTMVVSYAATDVTVEYAYIPADETLVRRAGGNEKIVLRDVEALEFKFFNLVNAQTTNLMEVKSVLMDGMLEKHAGSRENSDHIISARFMMRNRQISN